MIAGVKLGPQIHMKDDGRMAKWRTKNALVERVDSQLSVRRHNAWLLARSCGVMPSAKWLTRGKP